MPAMIPIPASQSSNLGMHLDHPFFSHPFTAYIPSFVVALITMSIGKAFQAF
jgi:hypothetical protein